MEPLTHLLGRASLFPQDLFISTTLEMSLSGSRTLSPLHSEIIVGIGVWLRSRAFSSDLHLLSSSELPPMLGFASHASSEPTRSPSTWEPLLAVDSVLL